MHSLRGIVLVSVLLAGCSSPPPSRGPMPIDPDGFAGRMHWLCRWGEPALLDARCLAQEHAPAQSARPARGAKPPQIPAKAPSANPPAEKAPVLTVDAGAAPAPAPSAAPAPSPTPARPAADKEPPAPDDDDGMMPEPPEMGGAA